jgi:hypothetical protein
MEKENYNLEKLPETNNEVQNVSELLIEPTQDYSQVILEASKEELPEGSEGLSTSYSHTWKDFERSHSLEKADLKLVELFKKAIAGNILCELGGAGGRMEFLAANMGASLYVEVDKYPNHRKNDPRPIDPTIGVVKKRDFVLRRPGMEDHVFIEGIYNEIHVRADMLDFISRLKDGSVNVVINGIDSFVIRIPEYHRLLAKEIMRVTKDGGVIFGNYSDSLFIIRKMIEDDPKLKERFEIVEAEVGAGAVVIHKKS